jgi:hypothetical protein
MLEKTLFASLLLAGKWLWPYIMKSGGNLAFMLSSLLRDTMYQENAQSNFLKTLRVRIVPQN